MKQETLNQDDNFSKLRLLPAVDALLASATARELSKEISLKELTEMARLAIEDLRHQLLESQNGNLSKEILLHQSELLLRQLFEAKNRSKFKRVINATGVVIHTNLGRAPLAGAAARAIAETGSSYCTLEYDAETGKRGRRGRQTEDLLCQLIGAESALVVNNCAAAAFLVLSALGAGGEAIVSRGELVEIGGDFRVPDIMALSGAKLVEVGTTNRTKIADFADAIGVNTKLIVRVHPSNFRIIGFTAMPEIRELAQLAHAQNILLYEDAGSGALVDLSSFGVSGEPLIADSVKSGADVVTFSGDKLLGGVQAGLIVGKAAVIEKLRKHPLYRALRVSKTIYAALAATLEIYQRETHLAEIPVLQMLSQTRETIGSRVADFIARAQKLEFQNLKIDTLDGTSAVGGGSAPTAELPTVLISLESKKISAAELERQLCSFSPPIISRTTKDKVLLDLRTIFPSEEAEILSALQQIESRKSSAI